MNNAYVDDTERPPKRLTLLSTGNCRGSLPVMQKLSASDAASPTQVQSRLLKGPSFADVVIQDAIFCAHLNMCP